MDYGKYLGVEKLLSIQKTQSEYVREESIFIITHQAIELWLKMLLVEIDSLKRAFLIKKYPEILSHLDRCLVFLNLMVEQFKGLNALSPLEFAKLRYALGTASGMQSIQFKLLNLSIGVIRQDELDILYLDQTSYYIPCNEESLRDIAYAYIHEHINGHKPKTNRETFVIETQELKHLYCTSHEINTIIDKLIGFDEALIYWKNAHISIVKRMIGNKMGTGATSINWLQERAEKPVFVQLWQLKNIL